MVVWRITDVLSWGTVGIWQKASKHPDTSFRVSETPVLQRSVHSTAQTGAAVVPHLHLYHSLHCPSLPPHFHEPQKAMPVCLNRYPQRRCALLPHGQFWLVSKVGWQYNDVGIRQGLAAFDKSVSEIWVEAMMRIWMSGVERECEGLKMLNGLTLLPWLAHKNCFNFKLKSIERSIPDYKG